MKAIIPIDVIRAALELNPQLEGIEVIVGVTHAEYIQQLDPTDCVSEALGCGFFKRNTLRVKIMGTPGEKYSTVPITDAEMDQVIDEVVREHEERRS